MRPSGSASRARPPSKITTRGSGSAPSTQIRASDRPTSNTDGSKRSTSCSKGEVVGSAVRWISEAAMSMDSYPVAPSGYGEHPETQHQREGGLSQHAEQSRALHDHRLPPFAEAAVDLDLTSP